MEWITHNANQIERARVEELEWALENVSGGIGREDVCHKYTSNYTMSFRTLTTSYRMISVGLALYCWMVYIPLSFRVPYIR
jgi:hypothetical protein